VVCSCWYGCCRRRCRCCGKAVAGAGEGAAGAADAAVAAPAVDGGTAAGISSVAAVAMVSATHAGTGAGAVGAGTAAGTPSVAAQAPHAPLGAAGGASARPPGAAVAVASLVGVLLLLLWFSAPTHPEGWVRTHVACGCYASSPRLPCALRQLGDKLTQRLERPHVLRPLCVLVLQPALNSCGGGLVSLLCSGCGCQGVRLRLLGFGQLPLPRLSLPHRILAIAIVS
jgi:hypothetical protein